MTQENAIETEIIRAWERLAAAGYHADRIVIERFSSGGSKNSPKNGVRLTPDDALFQVRCSLCRSYDENLLGALRSAVALVESETK